MGSRILTVLLCSSFPLLVVSNALESLRVCENVKKVSFLGFVPRQAGFQRDNRVSVSQKSETLRVSDALVQAAIELAVERINGDPNFLSQNITLEVLQLSDINPRYDRVSIKYYHKLLC